VRVKRELDHAGARRHRAAAAPFFSGERMQVAKDRVVAFDYTLKDDTGRILDSSEGGEPLRYIHGAGNIINGLESALEGASSGDRLDVSLAAADAYGERDESLVLAVGRERLSEIADLEVGVQFRASTSKGDRVFTVTAITGDQVTVDGNHPLAGQNLHFAVQVRDVRDATPDELDHGHVHHGDGHAH
jgi:FKBP-type peptidyl-prolyl cis-trans isomerase SlyD